MLKLIAIATLAALIAAPAIAQSEPAPETMPPDQACKEWGQVYRLNTTPEREAALRAHIKKTQGLTVMDITHASDRSVAVGMTLCGVLASKGNPDTINLTTTASGTSTRMIYRDDRMYVYTEPTGKVTTIQRH
jgi:hypothetical protein